MALLLVLTGSLCFEKCIDWSGCLYIILTSVGDWIFNVKVPEFGLKDHSAGFDCNRLVARHNYVGL